MGDVKSNLVKCWSIVQDVNLVGGQAIDIMFNVAPVAGKTLVSRNACIISTASRTPAVNFLFVWSDLAKVVAISDVTDIVKVEYTIFYTE